MESLGLQQWRERERERREEESRVVAKKASGNQALEVLRVGWRHGGGLSRACACGVRRGQARQGPVECEWQLVLEHESGVTLARGPIASEDSASAHGPAAAGGVWPAVGTRPGEARSEQTPQKCAGMRKLPARSDPIASGTMPAATAAALPPLDPPLVLAGSYGLPVVPNSGLKA